VDLLFTLLGILGSAMCVGMYYLLEADYVSATSFSYYSVNGLGAFLVLLGAFYSFDGGDLGAIVQEVCWVVISLLGIFKALKARQEKG
jgi:hypothetical protein